MHLKEMQENALCNSEVNEQHYWNIKQTSNIEGNIHCLYLQQNNAQIVTFKSLFFMCFTIYPNPYSFSQIVKSCLFVRSSRQDCLCAKCLEQGNNAFKVQ